MSNRVIKYGFVIEDDSRIYDTKFEALKLNKEIAENNLVYSIGRIYPRRYRRLYAYEPLLTKYDTDTVFELLKNNKKLKRERDNYIYNNNNYRHIQNMAIIYDYPAQYLTMKKFLSYKICQSILRKLD